MARGDDLMSEHYERRKVVVVGDSSTGKTSILYRVNKPNSELPEFPPTILENQVIRSDCAATSHFAYRS